MPLRCYVILCSHETHAPLQHNALDPALREKRQLTRPLNGYSLCPEIEVTHP